MVVCIQDNNNDWDFAFSLSNLPVLRPLRIAFKGPRRKEIWGTVHGVLHTASNFEDISYIKIS